MIILFIYIAIFVAAMIGYKLISGFLTKKDDFTSLKTVTFGDESAVISNRAASIISIVAIFLIWRMLRRFRRRAIEPFLDRADDQLDLAKARYAGFAGGIRAWLDTWRKKPPRLK